MVRKFYHVMFYGEISEGFSVADVRRNLAQEIDMDEATRQRLLDGKTVILRKHLDRMSASMFLTHCESYGACCRLELARVATGDETIDVYRLCRLEFRGEVLPGFSTETVKSCLQNVLSTTSHTIERLFSESSTIIKREVDFESALKFYDLFANSGARCRIVAVKTRLPEGKTFSEAVFRPAHLSLTICPKCDHTQPQTDLCERCGIAVRHFTRNMQSLDMFSGDRTGPHAQMEGHGNPDDYDDVGAEHDEPTPPEVYEIGIKDIAVWKIACVGNGILAGLLSFFHVDLTNLLVMPLSLIQGALSDSRGFWFVLSSNANILALTGLFFSSAMYVRRTLSNHKNVALHAAYLVVIIIPIGACITIDFFAHALSQGSGQLSATRFVLLALGFSAAAYGLGWLCLLPYILKHSTLPPSFKSDVEEFDNDESEEVDTIEFLGKTV